MIEVSVSPGTDFRTEQTILYAIHHIQLLFYTSHVRWELLNTIILSRCNFQKRIREMSGAGKGDTYRKGDKNKFDTSYEAIFGKKEILDFQHGLKTVLKIESEQRKTL